MSISSIETELYDNVRVIQSDQLKNGEEVSSLFQDALIIYGYYGDTDHVDSKVNNISNGRHAMTVNIFFDGWSVTKISHSIIILRKFNNLIFRNFQ